MTGMDRHCRIVSTSLSPEGQITEQTYASVAALARRLERLKSASTRFAGVELSPDVEQLRQRAHVLAVS